MAVHYSGEQHPVNNPADNRLTVGSVIYADKKAIEQALDGAAQAFTEWRLVPAATRAEYLLKAADLFEQQRLELVSLCIREGGRTIKDALAEVREAVDFCRYYAQSALELFSVPIKLPGPTGEENLLYHYGRGVFVCISPWNFPIAIFIGQITAALAAGNTVIAKPASSNGVNSDALCGNITSGRHTRNGFTIFTGKRQSDRAALIAGLKSCRCCFHWLHGNRTVYQPAVGTTPSGYRAVDCRNRRSECHDCR